MKDTFQTVYIQKKNTTEQSRIDRILISNHLITKINTIEHKIKLSDHITVELDLNFDKIKKWEEVHGKLIIIF